MALRDLFILELESYTRLCEKRKMELFNLMQLYPSEVSYREKYKKIVSVDDMVIEEIDKRLLSLSDTLHLKEEANEDAESLEKD
jgi:hypothetical protein